MPSELDSAKRGLVKLLRSLAEKHGVQLVLTRDSTNKQVQQAFRKIALKVHPDKGGELAVFQELSNMMDAWQDLLKKSESAGPGRRPKEDANKKQPPRAGKPFGDLAPTEEKKQYRVASQAVLLTYQGFAADESAALAVWARFVEFVKTKLREWGVKHWTATAETNENGKHHLHLMLQFYAVDGNRVSSVFAFEDVLPNASNNDILGEGFGGKRYQASWDRGGSSMSGPTRRVL